jgi:hypothetical protein
MAIKEAIMARRIEIGERWVEFRDLTTDEELRFVGSFGETGGGETRARICYGAIAHWDGFGEEDQDNPKPKPLAAHPFMNLFTAELLETLNRGN